MGRKRAWLERRPTPRGRESEEGRQAVVAEPVEGSRKARHRGLDGASASFLGGSWGEERRSQGSRAARGACLGTHGSNCARCSAAVGLEPRPILRQVQACGPTERYIASSEWAATRRSPRNLSDTECGPAAVFQTYFWNSKRHKQYTIRDLQPSTFTDTRKKTRFCRQKDRF